MPRLARIVMPDYPHHIIQRGNRREKVFFSDQDKQTYLDYLYNQSKEKGVEFWGYCIMDNHVHFIAVPKEENALAKVLSETHKQYSRMINFRNKWIGHLWEGRFKSCVLSQKHLYAALRYIERNPVRAGIVKHAEDYPFSSARAHIHKTKDKMISDNFLIDEIKDWRDYLTDNSDDNNSNFFIKNVDIGRPLGDNRFIEKLEKITGRSLKKKKPGPKVNN